ncbi:hypothetical protein U1Q18_042132, partial [Sarracenia purpurea var. burkii]
KPSPTHFSSSTQIRFLIFGFEFQVSVSNGLSSISAAVAHGRLFRPAHLVPWHRLQGFQIVVSGTRSQCASIRDLY